MDLAYLSDDTKGIKTVEIVEVDSNTDASDSTSTITSVLIGIYLVTKGDCTVVVIPNEMIAPLSFFNYIVIGSREFSENRECVLEHELAHIRGRHSLDLLLAQTICIAFLYNPAAWGIRTELTRVHEYLADEDVIASGADPKKYQMMLIGELSG